MPSSANSSDKKECDTNYQEQRKKLVGTYSEEGLYKLFKVRFREIFKQQTRATTVFEEEVEVIARQIWTQLPLASLEVLIQFYKLHHLNSAYSPAIQNDDTYQEQRKKIIGTLNDEELYTLFKMRFREVFQENAPGVTVTDEEFEAMAREAWMNLPISTLKALIQNYTIHVAKQAALKKTTTDKEGGVKKCNAKDCKGKCSVCRKNDEKVTKANDNGQKDEKKNGKGGKEDKKACGTQKECGKEDKKKDPPKRGKKKKDGNGKCKDNDCKCENERCGNCAQDQVGPPCKKTAEEKCAGKEKGGEGNEDDGSGCRNAKKRGRSQSDVSEGCKKKKRMSRSSSSSSSSGSPS